jgi:uncharacterized LabA/DUF88 family protein
MNLQELKCHNIKKNFQIDNNKFGKIFVFIDFANVNNWFKDDVRDWDNNILSSDKKLSIDIEKMYEFVRCFSDHIRFYYGHDPDNEKSLKFLVKTNYIFGKRKVLTKPIQKIKHYLEDGDSTTRKIEKDNSGNYTRLPKCNLDVEICVDAIRLMSGYDTFCIFSSDADFISLIRFLRKNRKKVILFKGGYVQYFLKENSDLVVSAQDIKKDICFIKQKSGC